MKTLAEFKRRIQIGVKVDTIYPSGLEIPTREISIKQTNSFALKTTKTDGSTSDSWMEYPTAKMIEFPSENKATIFWLDRNKNRIPCLTYIFV